MWERLVPGRRSPHHAQSWHSVLSKRCLLQPKRSLLTLAIETSCDDTSVAVLETARNHGYAIGEGGLPSSAKLHFHEKVTADNSAYGGIHPVIALQSHQRSLGPLVQRAMAKLPVFGPTEPMPKGTAVLWAATEDGRLRRKPDLIAVTRGPGMRANLGVGLQTAKGLALAWDIPMVGVHHMQAHTLTPRLVSALEASSSPSSSSSSSSPSRPIATPLLHNGPSRAAAAAGPAFPFLSFLVSGGHTMLLSSSSLTDHTVIANTADTSIGDCLDKCARAILPQDSLLCPGVPYGRALELFAFSNSTTTTTTTNNNLPDYARMYTPPATREQELSRRPPSQRFGWSLPVPLSESHGGRSTTRMEFSFCGLASAVQRIVDALPVRREPLSSAAAGVGVGVGVADDAADKYDDRDDDEQRRELAREVQRVAFEHLGGRLLLYLAGLRRGHHQHLHRHTKTGVNQVRTLVLSGGVAANSFLRHVLRQMLDARGYRDVEIVCPPVQLCTDNAAMIAWAGSEMFEAGWTSGLEIEPIKRWSLDSTAGGGSGGGGGILGVSGWLRRS